MATITFYGAAQEVTGSCHLVHSPAVGQILLDCGMHQGGDLTNRLHKEKFAFDPRKVNAVILSHTHLDHSGMLPRLVREGFNGPIYCTKATAQLLKILLKDALHIYTKDLEHENLRRKRSGKKLLEPDYTQNDVERVFQLCQTRPYGKPFHIGKDAEVVLHDAGHILGSAIVELKLHEKGQDKTLVFSGDLGNGDSALMNDPEKLEHADILLMEGTYGNRNHRPMSETLLQLEQVLAETWRKGGNVLIPSFAVERTQEILFHLGSLYHHGKLNNWQVFLDSPMAIEVTQTYDRWLELLDENNIRHLEAHDRESLQAFLPTLSLSKTPDDSMAINRIKQGAIIIAGSGMCTGGRIRHHLKHRIWDESNTLMFVGFQARGTLGRLLVDGAKHIKLFGEEYMVRANIETLGGFSAHAGQSQLLDWLSGFRDLKRLVLVHGEPENLEILSQKVWDEKGICADIPSIGSSLAF